MQLPNMEITSGGTIKPVWPLTTLAGAGLLSHCRCSCVVVVVVVEREKKKKGSSFQAKGSKLRRYCSVDFELREVRGVRLIRQDRLRVPEHNQCSISEEILSKASQ